MRRTILLLSTPHLLLIALLLLPGCRPQEPTSAHYPRGGVERVVKAAKPRPSASTKSLGFVATVENPGTAYFAVDGVGLVQLRDGTFSVLPEVRGMVKAMALSKDGLWVSNYSGLYLLDGKDQTPPKRGEFSNPGSVVEVVVSKDGTAWTLGYKGIGRYDGKGWTLFDRSKFGNAKLLRGLAVDGKGAAWVSTAAALYRREGPLWSVVDTSELATDKPFFDKLVSGPDGAIYASFVEGLVRCDAQGCHRHGKLRERPNAFAVAPDGRMLLVTRLNQISMLSAKGRQLIPVDPEEAGFRAKAVRLVASDGVGRFWLACDSGIVILDSEGKAVHWRPGQIEELSGDVNAILIEGDGPNLPILRTKAEGTVKGRVLQGDTPVSDATVEICESPTMFFEGSPCGQAAFQKSGGTDDDGAFTLAEVPVGAYLFAIKAGPRWVITLGGDCCSKMRHGQVYDVGSIYLREP